MASLTETSKRDFAKRILEVLKSSGENLKPAGVDASVKAAKLETLVTEAFAAEDGQIKTRAESQKISARSRETVESAYAEASAVVELIVGSLGKKDPLSRRLKSLRDEVSRESNRGPRTQAVKEEKKSA
ncbi:MAG: hypothetical protein AABZ39_13150 [Spirochaetota bacterium]